MTLQNNVLLPFLWHSQGCTLDFFSDVLFGRKGMEKLFIRDTFIDIKCQ